MQSLHCSKTKKLKRNGESINFITHFLFYVAAILHTMCTDFLQANVSAILYLVNYETFGRSTASAQYFLQLAGYLGIPVISWNADNSGLERTASQSRLQIQLGAIRENAYTVVAFNIFNTIFYWYF